MAKDWKIFFKEHSDCSIATYKYERRMSSYIKDTTGLIIEELYQAFKARLLEETEKNDKA